MRSVKKYWDFTYDRRKISESEKKMNYNLIILITTETSSNEKVNKPLPYKTMKEVDVFENIEVMRIR